MRYLLSIDQGTTTSRTVLFDTEGQVCSVAKVPFKQSYPQPGWVEHDAEEIYRTVCNSMKLAMDKINATAADILAIGITNQRETVVIWEKETGKPIYPAIVWQCRRTADICHRLTREGQLERIANKTGLLLDAYFSATKLAWILDSVPGARKRAEAGELLAGTIDTWLLWKLTGGRVHQTDVTNASRTLLFNIYEGRWDPELLELFEVPKQILPEVVPCAHDFGFVGEESLCAGDPDWCRVPIAGMAGDQQAALFGQGCFDVGMVKTTYGTGCFLLAQTGSQPVRSEHRLLTTVAWDLGRGAGLQYAIEGSVFHAGSTLQWLQDELGLLQSLDELEPLVQAAGELDDLYLIPAFTGLGAPYWNMEARGMILGLTRGTNRAQLCRAGLDATAYQVADVFDCIARDCRLAGVWKRGEEPVIRVDGGVSVNPTLLQEQADLTGCPVERPQVIETTALGAALFAGFQVGVWKDEEELRRVWKRDCRFIPQWEESKRKAKRAGWQKAVRAALFAAE